MKVKVYEIEAACAVLQKLRMQLLHVEDMIRDTQAEMSNMRLGGAAIAINASLRVQADVIRRRIAGMEQLYRVLHTAGEQYRRCEGEVEEIADQVNMDTLPYKMRLFAVKQLELPVVLPLDLIVAQRLQVEIVDEFIRPLMASTEGVT